MDLANIVQERGKLDVASTCRIEPECLSYGQREFDHFATMDSGVRVDRVNKVAEKESGPAVGRTQSERLLEPLATLASKQREQAHKRERDQDEADTSKGRRSDYKPDARETGICHVEPDH